VTDEAVAPIVRIDRILAPGVEPDEMELGYMDALAQVIQAEQTNAETVTVDIRVVRSAVITGLQAMGYNFKIEVHSLDGCHVVTKYDKPIRKRRSQAEGLPS
jgi:hypothetical protein